MKRVVKYEITIVSSDDDPNENYAEIKYDNEQTKRYDKANVSMARDVKPHFDFPSDLKNYGRATGMEVSGAESMTIHLENRATPARHKIV